MTRNGVYNSDQTTPGNACTSCSTLGTVCSTSSTDYSNCNVYCAGGTERPVFKHTINANGGSVRLEPTVQPVEEVYVWATDLGFVSGPTSTSPYTTALRSMYINFGIGRAGHTFAGGGSTASGGTTYLNANAVGQSALFALKRPTTIYARWTPNTATITLDSKYYASSTATSGTAVTTNAAPTPIYIKYDTGWYSNSSMTTAITKLSTNPAYTNYRFGGFYTGQAGTGTQMIDENGNLLAKSKTLYTAAGAAATWFAKWIPNTYFITLNWNLPTGEAAAVLNPNASVGLYTRYKSGVVCHDAACNRVVSATDPVVMPAVQSGGYEVMGYSSDTGVLLIVANGQLHSANMPWWSTITGNTTLYAQWVPKVSKVTLDNQGATTAGTEEIYVAYKRGFYFSNNISSSEMISSTNPISVPQKTGYTFAGYAVSVSDCNSPVIKSTGYPNAGIQPPLVEDTTFYACWEPNKYTVTLDKNNTGANDTGTGTTTLYTAYNTNVYLDSNRSKAMTTSTNAITPPKKEFTVTYNANGGSVSSTSATASSTFGGYYSTESSNNGSGTQYVGTQYITSSGLSKGKTITANATWYAKWSGGGVTLPTPTRSGHIFNGWYTAASGGTKVGAAGASYTPTASVTLYAQWSACSCTKGSNVSACSVTGVTSNACTYSYTCNTGYHTSGTFTGATATAANTSPSCSANDFTVTFKSGNTTLGTQSFKYGTAQNLKALSSLSNIPVDKNNGWEFVGWSTDADSIAEHGDGKSVSNLTTTNNDNVTLYGIWKRSVSFEYFSGASATSTTTSEREQLYYNTSTSAAAPSSVSTYALATQGTYNWVPKGWVLNSTSGTTTASTATTTVANVTPAIGAPASYTALYTRTATVAYNGNSSTSGSTTSTTGTQYFNAGSSAANALSLTLASNGFSRTGYSFSKWAAGSTSGTQYAAGASYTFPNTAWASTGTANMYAIWTKNSYTITVKAGNGVSTVAASGWTNTGTATMTKSFEYGATIDLGTVVTPTRKSGYTGVEYSKTSGSGTLSGTTFTVGAGAATITVKAAGITTPSVTLTPASTTKVYNQSATTLTATNSVTYDSGITVYYAFGDATSSTGTYTYGTAATADTSTVAKDAYRGTKFYKVQAYATDATDSTLTSSTATSSAASVTLNNKKITFNANGGTLSGTSPLYVSYSNASVYTGATNTTAGTVPTASKTGYTFNGWYTATSGGSQIYNASGTLTSTAVSGYTSGSKWVATADKTLYAQFAPNSYTISYTLNGGTHGTTHPTSAKFDTAFTVSNPTRSGYDFAGWKITGMDSVTHTYGSQTTTSTSISSTTATSFMNLRSTSGTVTFEAQWNTISYSITYYDGSTKITTLSPTSYTIETATITLPTPYKAGSKFASWHTDSALSSAAVTQIAKGSTGDKTYYARWDTCPAGSVCNGSSVTTCPIGSYCEEGSSEAAKCPGNMTSDEGSDEKTDCKITCSAGQYLVKNTGACTACTKGNFCASSGTYNFNASSDQGIAPCSGTNQWQANTGKSSCDSVTDGMYKSNNYTLQDCGTGWFCKSGARDQCPNSGTTASENASLIGQCYKTGLALTVTNGTGTQRCFYTSGTGTSAVYSTNCDTKTVTGCNAKFYHASGLTCTTVGTGYYSGAGALERTDCPTADLGWTVTSPAGTTYSDCYETKTGSAISSYCNAGVLKRVASSSTAYNATVTIDTALKAIAGAYVDGQTCTSCPADTGGRDVNSDSGASQMTDCYVTCPKTITVANASSVTVKNETLNWGGSAYPQCEYDIVCDTYYKLSDDGTSCELDVYVCTAGYADEAGKESCEDGYYCPGGNIKVTDVENADRPCEFQCPDDIFGKGTVSSTGKKDSISTCQTTREDTATPGGTGAGNQVCAWGENANKTDNYAGDCSITIESCKPGYYRPAIDSTECQLVERGQYSPNGEIEAKSCSDLPGALENKVNTADQGSDSAEDCYNICDEPPTTNNGTYAPKNETENYSIADARFPECTYNLDCKDGYDDVEDSGECPPNNITVHLDNDGDGNPDDTLTVRYGQGWYRNGKQIKDVEVPTSTSQNFAGYAYNNEEVINSDGGFESNTFVYSGTVTLVAQWGEKAKVSCEPGTYYSGTGDVCSPCQPGEYCPGVNSVYQGSGVNGRHYCKDLNAEYTPATDANGNELTVTISSKEEATSQTDCFVENVKYRADHATGSQKCYYKNNTFSNCTDQKVLMCDEGYYYESGDDCTSVGYKYYSPAGSIERSQCPGLTQYEDTITTETDTSGAITACKLGEIWEDIEGGGARTRCTHKSDVPTDLDDISGYKDNCDKKTVVTCDAGYYASGEACVKTEPGYFSPEQSFFTTEDAQPLSDAPGGSTKQYGCPDGGTTDEFGAAYATECYKDGISCISAIDHAKVATGTCHYSAQMEMQDADYTNCDATQCTIEKCNDGYVIEGNACVADPNGCDANYYHDGTECVSCSEATNGEYPLSQPGSTSIDECYVECTAPCVVPDSCPNNFHSCSWINDNVSGIRYHGQSECSSSNTICEINLYSATYCKSPYYMSVEKTDCSLSCRDISVSVENLPNIQSYTTSANAGISNGIFACYINGEAVCDPSDSYVLDPETGVPTGETKNYCPEHALTCKNVYKPTSGYAFYPSTLTVPNTKFCRFTFTCQAGYKESTTEEVEYGWRYRNNQYSEETPNVSCDPNTFAITLNDNAGTGGLGTIYQTYLTGWYSNEAATNVINNVSDNLPTRQYYTFDGYYTVPVAGVADARQVINSEGEFVDEFATEPNFTENTTLYAWWRQLTTTCQEGMYYTGNGQEHDVCPQNSFCDASGIDGTGIANMGTPGCSTSCPDGGLTDGSGNSSITKCYKVYNEGEEDAGGKVFDIENGTGSKKCYWREDAENYVGCQIEVSTCDAGYYESSPGTCSDVTSGWFSLAGDKGRDQCEPNGTYELGSDGLRGSQAACYTICNTYYPKVDKSTEITVAPGSENQRSDEDGNYGACLYNVKCETGYSAQNGANPSCEAETYTVILDKNGGAGDDIASSIACKFDSGVCALPQTSGLVKQGYVSVAKWCTEQNGSGICYAAGENVEENLSSDASEITLYAQWTPGVFKIELSTPDVDGLTPKNNSQGPVYLKYNIGWYQDAQGTKPLVNLTDLGNDLPTLDGYVFGGYKLGSTSIIDTKGVLQKSALTVVTNNEQTASATWSTGTITCEPGTYYPGSGNTCQSCTKNYFCDKEITVGTNSGEAGRTECPNFGLTDDSGKDSITMCYMEHVAYTTELDSGGTRARGTRTCFYNEISGYTNCDEDTIIIEWCAGGYWYSEEDKTDCVAVGEGWWSAKGDLINNQCPNGGNTGGETESDEISDCIKNMPYESGTKNARGTCDRYSDANGVYNSACITGTVEITWCAGGYWYSEEDKTDCIEVGKNWWSADGDLGKDQCPADGKTTETTAETPIEKCRQTVPYPSENDTTVEVHGSGEQSCAYAGDSYKQYNDGYINNCNTVIITKCDAGYYREALTSVVCVPIPANHYGPVAEPGEYSIVYSKECPKDAESGKKGVTDDVMTPSARGCYIEKLSCDIANGTGEQTRYYDSDVETKTGGYNVCKNGSCAETCVVVSCNENYQQVGNTCISCPANHVCKGGEEKTCASFGDGTYTESDPGTDNEAQCYRECAMAGNAYQMAGRDYLGQDDTCEIAACAPGYDLQNGKCVTCAAGEICNPDNPDTDGDGKPDAQTCASMTDGTHTMSDKGVSSVNDCYATCSLFENAEQMAGRDYFGKADTCEIVVCKAGYNLEDGKCVPCDEGYVCNPDNPDEDGDNKPDAQTCASLTGGTHTMSDKGASSADNCYRTCGMAENAYQMAGRDYYQDSLDTCEIIACAPGYNLVNGKCVTCAAGEICNPNNPDTDGDGKPDAQTCKTLTGGTHTMSDKGMASVNDCYRTCDMAENAHQMAGRDYFGKTDTCEIVACIAGYDLQSGKCVTCAAGEICNPNNPDTDGDGKPDAQTCKTLTGGTHTMSDAGMSSADSCYRTCDMVANATEMSGRDYYLDSKDTCKVVSCEDGFSLVDNACSVCPSGSFCDPTYNNGQPQKCPTTHPNSDVGIASKTECFTECEAYKIVYGTALPVEEVVFYPSECEFYGVSDTGNPCDIIEKDGKQVCAETSCNYNFELIDGVCEPCARENAISYKQGGNCVVESCATGYHPNGQECEDDVIVCSAPNAVAATQVWNAKKNAFGECIITECKRGYHLGENVCQLDEQTCELEHGIGRREWDVKNNKWGECIAIECDPGYTNDPSQTNELWQQCGRCNNMYSANGKLAASSYVKDCEIAACMYQGELYNLENNECVLICDTYSDETGSRRWDDNLKKCVRDCKPGYMTW